MRNRVRTVALPWAVLALAASAEALTPDQMVIVVRRTDAQGARVARHYCEQRGVERERIIPVDLPAADRISWQAYQSQLVEPIRATLQRKKLAGTRCLLLAGTMPLRVEPDPATAAEKRETQQLRDAIGRETLELYQQAWRMDQISLGNVPGRPPDELPKNIPHSWEAEKYYRESLDRAQQALARLSEARRKALTEQLARARQAVEGLACLAEPEPTDTAAADFQQRHEAWKKNQERLKQANDKLQELRVQRGPVTVREERRKGQFETNGLIGLLRQMHSDVGELNSANRLAALDSELALLWRDNYPLDGAQSNPLRGRGLTAKVEPDTPPAAVMVVRLDGFDPAQPIRLIDDALAVEKAGQGLVGRLCLDAQGLPKTDSLFNDDQAILILEEWKNRPASLTIAKDASPAVLTGAQANPIAFYVGCGSFDRFPGGYQCVQGAVAISVNPTAAGELHDARSRQWCNGFLSAGAGAVIGAVEQSDPRVFMDYQNFAEGLLVEGLALAEAYWRATYFVSWRAIIIGDPLYRPAVRKAEPPKAAPGK